MFTYVEKSEKTEPLEGEFAALTAHGLPQERADFFLDPWNNPYWIRHECSEDRRSQRAFVYSFGANHKRDSSEWEIRGDDIGTLIVERGKVP